jgi:carbon-monoxide dehydrogenase small subunit
VIVARDVTLVVNGAPRALRCEPRETLLQVLRARCGLIGPKYGCGIGYCGACTVIVDGRLAHSCCLLAVTLDGSTVTTVEGLAESGRLSPAQSALVREGAIQCGYCTPGIAVTLHGLLAEQPQPTPEEARAHLVGNICRCTGFASIVRAAVAAGEEEGGP